MRARAGPARRARAGAARGRGPALGGPVHARLPRLRRRSLRDERLASRSRTARASCRAATRCDDCSPRWCGGRSSRGGSLPLSTATRLAPARGDRRRPGSGAPRGELHERSGGNPFFVEELFAARRDDLVPDTVAETVLARVQRLSPEAQRLLDGRRGRRRARRSRGAGAERARARAGAARGARRRPGDRDRRRRLAAARADRRGRLRLAGRRRANRAASRARRGAGRGRRIRGAARRPVAARRRVDAALAASVAAGVEAEAVYAYPEAREHFERALELWDVAERCGRASIASSCCRARRRPRGSPAIGKGASRSAARPSSELDVAAEPARAARLYERLGEYASWDDRAALDCYEQALVLLPAGRVPERSRLLAAQGHALMGLRRWEESRVCCEAALAAGRRPAAGLTLGLVLAFLGDAGAGERRCAGRSRRRGAARTRRARTCTSASSCAWAAARRRAGGDGDRRARRRAARHARHVRPLHVRQRRRRPAAPRPLGRGRGRGCRRPSAWTWASPRPRMHGATAGHLHALRGEEVPARRHLERALELAGEGLPGEFVVPIRSAWAALALAAGRPGRGAPPRRRRVRRGGRRPRPALHAGAALARRPGGSGPGARVRRRRRPARRPRAAARRRRRRARRARPPGDRGGRASRARERPEPALWQAAADAWAALAEPYPRPTRASAGRRRC